MNSLKCQPEKVYDCLMAKANWIFLSEPIYMMQRTITRAGGSLAVALTLQLRSLHIYRCHFPFHVEFIISETKLYKGNQFCALLPSTSSFSPFARKVISPSNDSANMNTGHWEMLPCKTAVITSTLNLDAQKGWDWWFIEYLFRKVSSFFESSL